MLHKNKYIAIEGNIGAGKTSLSQLLAKDWNYHLVLEQFTDNPFLPLFYENPERYAFQVELFFMVERHKQLQALFSQPDLFQQNTIADYFFIKTLLFAKKTLLEEENRLFQQLFHTLNAHFPKPDLLVYIHRPIKELKQYIEKRGRIMEQEIEVAYLEKVQKAYFEYLKMPPDFPIIVLDMEGVNFVEDIHAYQQIRNILEYAPMEKEVHYLTVKNGKFNEDLIQNRELTK